MPLVIQADQMSKEMNSAQHTDYDADALPLLLLQVLPACFFMSVVSIVLIKSPLNLT